MKELIQTAGWDMITMEMKIKSWKLWYRSDTATQRESEWEL